MEISFIIFSRVCSYYDSVALGKPRPKKNCDGLRVFCALSPIEQDFTAKRLQIFIASALCGTGVSPVFHGPSTGETPVLQ